MSVIYDILLRWRGHAVARLKHCATSRKVAGSFPDGVIGIFHWHNPSGRTMALGLTQGHNAAEMGTARRSARISKLDGKTNEYIREKMDAPDTILIEITRKQLIWYWNVERMDRTRLPKLWLTGNLEEGKIEAVPEELGKMGYSHVYSREWKRTKSGRMEQRKAMEYGSRKA